jgi:hypothetical protein
MKVGSIRADSCCSGSRRVTIPVWADMERRCGEPHPEGTVEAVVGGDFAYIQPLDVADELTFKWCNL